MVHSECGADVSGVDVPRLDDFTSADFLDA